MKKAAYAYGPKQEFDPSSQETHVWLPYGSTGACFETAGVKLTDPGPSWKDALWCLSVNGNTSGRLVFKLHLNKPIGGFRFYAGWSERGVGGETVGGVGYSVDGEVDHHPRNRGDRGQGRDHRAIRRGQKAFSGLNTRGALHSLLQSHKNQSGGGRRNQPLDEISSARRPNYGATWP